MLRLTYHTLEKVPFSTLFRHNYVLEKVFSAPASRIALSAEVSAVKKNYTYGQLQRDVIKLADAIVSRKNFVHCCKAAGEKTKTASSLSSLKNGDRSSLMMTEALNSWMQPPRSAHIRSVFSEGEGFTPSCDALSDSGSYVTAILAPSGYPFVVSLLASWAVNCLVTVMSTSQNYKGELTYVLEHSGARMVLGEASQLKAKFPTEYDSLLIRNPSDITNVAKMKPEKAGPETYEVHSVIEVSSSLLEALPSSFGKEFSASRLETLEPEELNANNTFDTDENHTIKKCNHPLRTAEDVVNRLEDIKLQKADDALGAKVRLVEKEFERQRRSSQKDAEQGSEEGDMEEYSVPLQFDSERAKEELNPCFLKWYLDPASRPTPYDDGLMVYTSGTTAKPKGVVHNYSSIRNQVECLQNAWAWRRTDVILHLLPLHHIHGLINVLLCSLCSHARCVLSEFDAHVTPQRIQQGDITLFMGVPTMYNKMIAAIRKDFSPVEKKGFRTACETCVRLMVSGSASLPIPTLEQFRELSGHILLERYGMTEIGMGLSQPLYPVQSRLPGTVGSPLPTVETWVIPSNEEEEKSHSFGSTCTNDDGASSEVEKNVYDEVGALAIASKSLFDRYWKNPSATRKELRIHPVTKKKYFDTGDTVGKKFTLQQRTENSKLKRDSPSRQNDDRKATYSSDDVVFTILGRSSVDIIKRGGYKLSALEIEAALLSRKDLFYEVVVVGCPDKVYGEEIVAIVALQPSAIAARHISLAPKNEKGKFTGLFLTTDALTAELKEAAVPLLASYKRPDRYLIVPEILRNATGKVNKKELKKQLGLP